MLFQGIQTRLKVLNIPNAYETLKDITRKNEDTKKELDFINTNTSLSNQEKIYLGTLTPFNYTGVVPSSAIQTTHVKSNNPIG